MLYLFGLMMLWAVSVVSGLNAEVSTGGTAPLTELVSKNTFMLIGVFVFMIGGRQPVTKTVRSSSFRNFVRK